MTKRALPSPILVAARQLLHIRHVKHIEAGCRMTGKKTRSKPKLPINLPAGELAATVLLGAALGTIPSLIDRILIGEPIVLILEMADSQWADALGTSARACFRVEPEPSDCERIPADPKPPARSAYVCSVGTRTSAIDAQAVAIAIGDMRPVIGIAANPNAELPDDILRTCDHRIVVGRLDADLLALAIEAVVGSPPLLKIRPEILKSMRFQDIRLAVHRDRSADGCIERLEAIVRPSPIRQSNHVRLENLAGYGSVRDIGIAIAEDLGKYSRRELPWSEVERGLLLWGPPGTGKTLFASALAAQAGVELTAGSLAEWQGTGEAHLGTTLKAMRAAFSAARLKAPSILFIDELDSFGDRRTFENHHRHYSTQVTNGLLELLDGCIGREGVYLVGASNTPEHIDPAIIRSGRFDRHMELTLPSIADIEAILRFHLGRDLVDDDLRPAARRAIGCTGADLANFVRQARGIARRLERPLETSDLLTAISGQVATRCPEAIRRTAIHEAGHAVAAYAFGLEIGDIAIQIALAKVNGFTSVANPEIATEESCRTVLVVAMAGRAAELVLLGVPSAGAAADLEGATAIATKMHTRWGLGRWLAVHSESVTDRDVAAAVEAELRNAFQCASDLLEDRRDHLTILAQALLEHHTLTGSEIANLLDVITKPKEGRGLRSGPADCD